MYRNIITQSEIKAVLRYDPDTGNFYWLSGTRKGRLAGTPLYRDCGDIRWRIQIDSKTFADSVLAWVYMTGEMPEGIVDHKDNDTLNCRWNNLQDITQSANISKRTCYAGRAL